MQYDFAVSTQCLKHQATLLLMAPELRQRRRSSTSANGAAAATPPKNGSPSKGDGDTSKQHAQRGRTSSSASASGETGCQAGLKRMMFAVGIAVGPVLPMVLQSLGILPSVPDQLLAPLNTHIEEGKAMVSESISAAGSMPSGGGEANALFVHETACLLRSKESACCSPVVSPDE